MFPSSVKWGSNNNSLFNPVFYYHSIEYLEREGGGPFSGLMLPRCDAGAERCTLSSCLIHAPPAERLKDED